MEATCARRSRDVGYSRTRRLSLRRPLSQFVKRFKLLTVLEYLGRISVQQVKIEFRENKFQTENRVELEYSAATELLIEFDGQKG